MKKKLIIAAVTVVIVIAAVILLLPKSADTRGTVVSKTVIELEEEVYSTVVCLKTDDGNTIYVRIADNVSVTNTSGVRVPSDSFMEGDVLQVWYKKSASNEKFFEATKVIYEYNVNSN